MNKHAKILRVLHLQNLLCSKNALIKYAICIFISLKQKGWQYYLSNNVHTRYSPPFEVRASEKFEGHHLGFHCNISLFPDIPQDRVNLQNVQYTHNNPYLRMRDRTSKQVKIQFKVPLHYMSRIPFKNVQPFKI